MTLYVTNGRGEASLKSKKTSDCKHGVSVPLQAATNTVRSALHSQWLVNVPPHFAITNELVSIREALLLLHGTN